MYKKIFNGLLERLLPSRLFDAIRHLNRPDKSAMLYGDITYNQDNLLTLANADFMHDALFKESYELGKATDAASASKYDPAWRVYVNCWAASHALHLEGDFVECGVYRGWTARAVVNYVKFEKVAKAYYLIDTYKGLVPEFISDEEKKHGIDTIYYEDCYEAVLQTFAPFSNVKVIRGRVPEILSEIRVGKVSYLSIDMNNRLPEIAAAEYFWDKLVTGAIIVLDDYGFSDHIEQKLGFDEFAKEKNVQVLALPTGQGLIVKP